MVYRLGDMCRQETDASSGTATLVLGDVVTGYQSFDAGVGNGNETDYAIRTTTAWIVCRGRLDEGTPDALTRTKILASSNNDQDITFVGTVEVYGVASADILNFLRVKTNVQQERRTTSIADPTDLTFQKRGTLELVELLCPALTDLRTNFTHNAGHFPNSVGSMTRTYNGTQLSMSGSSSFSQQWTDIVPKAPHYCVIAEVSTKGSGATWNDYYVGLLKDTNNRMQAVWDATANTCWIEVVSGGSGNNRNSVSFSVGNAPFKLAFVITERNCQAWFNSAAGPAGIYSGWRYVTSWDLTEFDLRDPAVLKDFHPGFGFYSGGSTTAGFESFECGHYGQIALRDPRPVVYKDGTPYIRDGEYYFMMTCGSYAAIPAGVLSGGYSHGGIFAFNPKSRSLRKTGAFFVRRGDPAKILTDHAGQIIFDTDKNAWRILLSTWGNRTTGSEVAISHQLYKGDILNGVTILEDTSNLAITQFTGTKGVYDPSMLWDADAEIWRIAYTHVPDTNFGSQTFATALDHSADLVTFTNDFVNSTTGYEGTQLIQLGGSYYVLAGSNANVRAYDTDGTVLGTLNITLPTTVANPPWPTVFPVMDGGQTRFWMITFNGSGFGSSLGALASLVLYEADETETGFEFDLHGVT